MTDKPCGCKIEGNSIPDIYGDVDNSGLSIFFCPLHALAPRMLEFIRDRALPVLIAYQGPIGPYKQHPLYVMGSLETIEEARSIVSEIEKENV